MQFRTLLAAIALTATAACVTEQDTGGLAKPLPNCGKIVSSRGAAYSEQPITDEGAGLVGIGTQQQTADGKIHQRFSLVNCSAKTITRVEQNWTLATAPTAGNTVQDLIGRLRAANRLAASGQLAREGRAAGYTVTEGKVDAAGNPRARCGCETYYPDLLWQ